MKSFSSNSYLKKIFCGSDFLYSNHLSFSLNFCLFQLETFYGNTDFVKGLVFTKSKCFNGTTVFGFLCLASLITVLADWVYTRIYIFRCFKCSLCGITYHMRMTRFKKFVVNMACYVNNRVNSMQHKDAVNVFLS